MTYKGEEFSNTSCIIIIAFFVRNESREALEGKYVELFDG